MDDDDRMNIPTVPGGVLHPKRGSSPFDVDGDRYREGSELGRGGMGRVIEATDRALTRDVAIKYLLASGATELARFEREVRITAKLQHPSIVPILDAGRDRDGQPYYVMRKVDGEPLDVRIASSTERIALVPAVLGALDAAAYAHANRIVHRDIKPNNILLGPFGETLLIDWGLARELDEAEPARVGTSTSLTLDGLAYGTPGYMAPEQARGEDADARADVYALGATLYHVLVGAPPFSTSGPTEAIASAAAGQEIAASVFPDEVPFELIAIVQRAMQPEPAARYRDAKGLADDVRRFLAGQLVAAHRYTTAQRIVKWLRRHLAITIAVTLALVATILVTVFAAVRIVRARDLAQARSEELVIDRARGLIDQDPTSAIAALRDLPAHSSEWAAAREVVRAAVANGVETSVQKHDGFVQALAFRGDKLASADARTIAVGGKIVAQRGAAVLEWLDDATLVVADGPVEARTNLALLDVTTGRSQAIGSAARAVAVAADRVIVLDADGTARSITRAGQSITLASGVARIAANGRAIALATSDRVVSIDPAGVRRELAIAHAPYEVRISSDGTHVAVRMPDGVLELAPFSRSSPAVVGNLIYVDDRLYAWSEVEGGLVAISFTDANPTWPLAHATISVATGDHSAVVATRDGRLAYVDPLGATKIPHRAIELTAIGLDGAGRRLALGTAEGDVLVVDLAPSRPAMVALQQDMAVLAVEREHVVVGNDHDVAMIDLATGDRVALPPLGFSPGAAFVHDAVIVWSALDSSLVITDRRGKLRAKIEKAPAWGITETAVVWLDANGVLHEQPFAAGQPDAVLPYRAAHTSGVHIDAVPGGVLIYETWPDSDGFLTKITLRDASGSREIPTPKGMLRNARRDAAGTWWMIAQDTGELWRVPAGGTPEKVALGERARLLIVAEHIWVLGEKSVIDLDPAGHPRRGTSIVLDGDVSTDDHDLVRASREGLEIIDVATGTRRSFHLPVPIVDGRAIGDDAVAAWTAHTLAVWRDPVPKDPASIPAFIDHLTNARLQSGSDVVTWR